MSSTHNNCSTPVRGKKAPKKQPGRGMGVAQLERIRIHNLITDPALHCPHFHFNYKKKRVVNGEGFVENKFFQGPEIVAVHRKGRSIGSVVMEYGFFPTTSSSSSTLAAAASSSTSTAYPSSTTTTTSIDLSLRL